MMIGEETRQDEAIHDGVNGPFVPDGEVRGAIIQQEERSDADDMRVLKAILGFAHACVDNDELWAVFWAAAKEQEPQGTARPGTEKQLRDNIHAAITLASMKIMVAEMFIQAVEQHRAASEAQRRHRRDLLYEALRGGPDVDPAGSPTTYM